MNKKISTPLALGIVLVLAILVGFFTITQYLGVQKENFNTSDLMNQQKIEATTIKDITINPQQYENKEVIIDGWYGGWDGAQCNNIKEIAMRTKNDALIYDNTGCLYMCGDLEILYKEKELSPSNNDNIGGKLKIRGIINLIEGKPCIGSEEEIKQTEILKNELTGWNVYRNLLYGYEIEYPSSYSYLDESDKTKEVIIGDYVMPYYSVSVKENFSSLDELKSLMNEDIKKIAPSDLEITWKDSKISNEKAIEMSYENFAGGYTGITHRTGVIKNSIAYIITLINGSETEYYKILSNFKFIEEENQLSPNTIANFVYLTDIKYDGNLGGRIGADEKCGSPDGLNCKPGTIHAFITVDSNDSIIKMDKNYNFNENLSIYWFNRDTKKAIILAENWSKMINEDIINDQKDGTGKGEWSGDFPWTGGKGNTGYLDSCNKWTTNEGDPSVGSGFHGIIGGIDKSYWLSSDGWAGISMVTVCANKRYLRCMCEGSISQ